MRLGAIGAILLLVFSISASAAVYELQVTLESFNPTDVTINAGDTVQFTNMAGSRRIAIDDGRKSGMLSAGTSTSLAFDQVGTFTAFVAGEPEIEAAINVVQSGAPAPHIFYTEDTVPEGEIIYIAVDEYEYIPSEIEVNIGDTLVWENIGSQAHSVDFFDDEFEKGTVNQEITYNRTFIAPGEYAYRCRFHNAMKGLVKVVDPNAPAPSSTPAPQTSSSLPPGEQYDVTIANMAYETEYLEVMVGDTVTWYNTDEVPHTATAVGGSFDTDFIEPDSSASHTFTQPGTYTYSCSLHPDMTATIVVSEPGVPTTYEEPTVTEPTYQEPVIDSPPPVITNPVASSPPPTDIDQRIESLRTEFISALSAQGGGATDTRIADVESRMGTVESQVTTLAGTFDSLRQDVTRIDRIATNPPQIEMPSVAPPVLVYLSLALSVLGMLMLLGLGIYVLKKPHPAQPLPTPPKPAAKHSPKQPEKTTTEGVSSVVKPKSDQAQATNSPQRPSPSTSQASPSTAPAIQGKDPTQVYVARCREKGLSDEEIISRFMKSGWSKERALNAVRKR